MLRHTNHQLWWNWGETRRQVTVIPSRISAFNSSPDPSRGDTDLTCRHMIPSMYSSKSLNSSIGTSGAFDLIFYIDQRPIEFDTYKNNLR